MTTNRYVDSMHQACTQKLDRLLKKGFTEVITSLRKEKSFLVTFKYYISGGTNMRTRTELFSTWHGAVTYAAILGQSRAPRIRHISIVKAVDEVVAWRYAQ